ncbi:MAG: hypothetical protein ACLP1Y_08825 [Candidatus Acidiferrales bacterium]
MNLRRIVLGLTISMALCLGLGASQTATQDRRNFWALNNTGKEIHSFFVSPHTSDQWGDDILGRATLLDGMGTLIYFNSSVRTGCNFDFKLVYADGTAQVYTQGRNVCEIHAVQFNPDTSDGF